MSCGATGLLLTMDNSLIKICQPVVIICRRNRQWHRICWIARYQVKSLSWTTERYALGIPLYLFTLRVDCEKGVFSVLLSVVNTWWHTALIIFTGSLVDAIWPSSFAGWILKSTFGKKRLEWCGLSDCHNSLKGNEQWQRWSRVELIFFTTGELFETVLI